MTVSLEKYDDLFKRLIRANSDAREVEQELALCTTDTYESAKMYGFKPVLVDSDQLELMPEDARALTVAYALGKTIYGEECFSQPLEKVLNPRDSDAEEKGRISSSLKAMRESLNNVKKGQVALKTTVQMVVKAGYSLGDALEGYYNLGYTLDPLLIWKLSEQSGQNNSASSFFRHIETEEVPVFAGIGEDPRYAMEGGIDSFMDTGNQAEHDKMMRVYYLALDKELKDKFGITPMIKDPDFTKLCQIVNEKLEEQGQYLRMYKMPMAQKEAFMKSSRSTYYKAVLIFLEPPERQQRPADEWAFILLRDFYKAATRGTHVLIASPEVGIKIMKLDPQTLKTQMLTETVNTFLKASYNLSTFLEGSKELSVDEKMKVIQIALSQETVKLSSEEEKKLMDIGTNLQKQENTPQDPKNLGGQSAAPKGPRGNPGKE